MTSATKRGDLVNADFKLCLYGINKGTKFLFCFVKLHHIIILYDGTVAKALMN